MNLEAGEGELGKASTVNASQILTVDKSRFLKKLGTLSPERMKEVDKALKISLGLYD